MNLLKVASFSALLALAGCQDVVKNFEEIASEKTISLIIAPGYRVVANSESAMVFGFENCPENHPIMQQVFGDSAKSSCVVITPETKKVLVRLIFNDKILTEEWNVVREKEKKLIYLTRPDGSPIERHSENIIKT